MDIFRGAGIGPSLKRIDDFVFFPTATMPPKQIWDMPNGPNKQTEVSWPH